MKNSLILLFISFLIINSCASKKNIVYVQDFNLINESSLNFYDYKIKEGDILKIDVINQNLVQEVDLVTNNANQNRESLIFQGHTVNKNGMITIDIGEVKLSNLTLNQAKDKIQLMYINSEILTNPLIDIKVLNWSVTVLGEVNNPGKYYFDEPNLSFFQALGLAGDLTINGERKNIKIIRKDNNKFYTYVIDLTKSNSLNQINYQIMPGDIIIVDPNTNRIKNAGIIGNSGTLLSLLSFILSTIIITTN